jgi:hypothetical protein
VLLPLARYGRSKTLAGTPISCPIRVDLSSYLKDLLPPSRAPGLRLSASAARVFDNGQAETHPIATPTAAVCNGSLTSTPVRRCGEPCVRFLPPARYCAHRSADRVGRASTSASAITSASVPAIASALTQTEGAAEISPPFVKPTMKPRRFRCWACQGIWSLNLLNVSEH